MLSMTGFGTGEANPGPVTITVELRSVNHRFLDVSLKLPGSLAPLEADIRKFLKDNVARGRVTVSAQLQLATAIRRTRGSIPSAWPRACPWSRQAAEALEKETGQAHPVTLDHLLNVPDLFRAEEPELRSDDLQTALLDALAAAHADCRT